MNILTRGTVINIGEQKVVVLLEQHGSHGWNALCVSAHPGNIYYRQDIFVFMEELKNGKILSQIEVQ